MASKKDAVTANDFLLQVERTQALVGNSALDQNAQAFDFQAFLDTYRDQLDIGSKSAASFLAFSRDVDSEKTDLPASREAALHVAEEHAAVSGRFNPDDIVPPGLAADDRQRVLSELVKGCAVETSVGVRWMLQHRKRTEVLIRLADAGRLAALLDASLPQTDRFGELLRAVLREGDAYDYQPLAPDDQLILVHVLETLGDTGVPVPDLQDVKALASARAATAGYEVLSRDFIGRTAELDRLHAFLQAPDPAAGRDWRGLVVTGLGGVGKSTLLAKFAGDVLKEGTATVVWLDFDRPGISPADSSWLALECSRQVGRQYPEIQPRLRAARDAQRTDENASGMTGYSKLEWSRAGLSPLRDIQDALLQAGAGNRPLLVVLDTLEEVTQTGTTGTLVEWLTNLSLVLNRLRVKVIFSGRLFDEQLAQLAERSQVAPPVAIDAFDAAIAVRFLQREGLDAATAEDIVRLEGLPLRPLELKLVARVLATGSTSICDLTEDLKNIRRTDATVDLFAGIVYRRVLLRIRDPLVRQLAYPGLILRYLTPEILRKVLLPVLNNAALDRLTDDDLDALTDRFGSYAWLAYRDERGAIWHRKDLRRSMLRLMASQEAEKAAEIRKAAVAFFESQGTPEAAAEASYHRLMDPAAAGGLESFDPAELRHQYPRLSADLADLPREAAVLLQYYGTGTLADTDVFLLPPSVFLEVWMRVAQKQVTLRNYAFAVRLIEQAQALGSGGLHSMADRSPWMHEAWYATGTWEPLFALYEEGSPPTVFEEDIPLQALHAYLYPQALLAPQTLRLSTVESLLRRASKAKSTYRLLSNPEARITVLQLAVCLLLLDENEVPLNAACKRSIDRLIDNIEGIGHLRHGRELFLLDGIAGRDDTRDNYVVRLPDVRLHASWLNRLQELPQASKGFWRDFIDDTWRPIGESLVGKTLAHLTQADLSSKMLLLALDSDEDLRMEWSKTAWSLRAATPDSLYQLLRGPHPFFRDPCRYALMEAFPDANGHAKLATLLQSLLPFPLTDLEPAVFCAQMAEGYEHALEPFVEIADRCWVLDKLLLRVVETGSGTRKISNLLTAYERFDSALRDLTDRV